MFRTSQDVKKAEARDEARRIRSPRGVLRVQVEGTVFVGILHQLKDLVNIQFFWMV